METMAWKWNMIFFDFKERTFEPEGHLPDEAAAEKLTADKSSE